MNMLDWTAMRDENLLRLEQQTGKSVTYWTGRIRKQSFKDREALRQWLETEGVVGYPSMFLVMETFGYPDYMTATADELINQQYADREALRPVLEAILNGALQMGEMTVQARKGFVALLTTKRTFARIKPTTRSRIDVGLRLATQLPEGRLKPCKMEENMKVQVSASTVEDVDADFLAWVRMAYLENC